MQLILNIGGVIVMGVIAICGGLIVSEVIRNNNRRDRVNRAREEGRTPQSEWWD